MELGNFTFWIIGVFSLFIGIIAKPYIDAGVMRLKRLFTRKKRTPPIHMITAIDLQAQIDEIKEQIDNLIEIKYNRDKNRKYNLRRDVREYLNELKNGE